MKTLQSLLLLGLALVISNAAERTDEEVLADAVAARKDMCSRKNEEMTEELRAERRSTIQDASEGQNIFYKILTASEDERSGVIEKEADPALMARKALPMIFAFVMLPIFLICCWTACPCCKCCRIGSGREKTTPFLLKAGITAVLAIILILVIIFANIAIQGHATGMDGVYTTSCEAANVIVTVLNGAGEASSGGNASSGTGEAAFIGFNPLLAKVEDLKANLNDGSDFMTDVTKIIDSTENITNAVAYASGRLALLKMVMEDPFNKQPYVNTNGDGYHNCKICEELPKILAPAVTALGGSLGQALADAREQIETQLNGETRVELRSQLDQAASPIGDMKKTVKNSVGFMVDKENYVPIVTHMDKSLGALVLLVSLLFILVSVCGLASAGYWTAFGDKANQVGVANPYYKGTHRIACCTWCSTFFMVFLTLLVGGIVVIVVYLMSNLCVLLDEVDGPMLKDIMNGMNDGGESKPADDSAVEVLDKCFLQTSVDPVNVLELITVDSNGDKVTFKAKFDSEVKGQIDEKFDSVASKMSMGNQTMATNPEFNRLLAIIRNNPLDAMYLPDYDDLIAQGAYSGMSSNTDLAALAGTTGLRCTPHTMSNDFDAPLAGTSVTGIQDFDTQMATMGTPLASTQTCGKLVTCTNPGDTACSAGNNYLQLKNQLKLETYKCGFFESVNHPGSQAHHCDPATHDDSNCLFIAEDGSKALKPALKDCSWDEYVAHYAAFETQLKADLLRIDTVAAGVQDQITQDLKKVVGDYLLAPIDDIVNQVTCNFLSQAYQGFVDGFCFQGIIGLRSIGGSSIICGFLGIVLIIITYGIWRRSIDNVNAFDKTRAELDSTRA